ncbi:hypothetical protein VTN96DRAFT_8457 [Rasamsonia emersonii]
MFSFKFFSALLVAVFAMLLVSVTALPGSKSFKGTPVPTPTPTPIPTPTLDELLSAISAASSSTSTSATPSPSSAAQSLQIVSQFLSTIAGLLGL